MTVHGSDGGESLDSKHRKYAMKKQRKGGRGETLKVLRMYPITSRKKRRGEVRITNPETRRADAGAIES
jgi:hypothetical protein